MKTVLFFFLLSFAILSRANSQTQFPQNYEAFYQKAINQINPIYVKGIKANAIKIKDKNVSVVDIKSMISQDKTFNNIQNEDIESIVVLVMMQAAKDAHEEQKEILNKIKATNKKKKELGEALEKLDKNKNTITRTQLDSVKLLLLKKPSTTLKSDRQRVYTTKINTVSVKENEVDATMNKAKSDLDSLSEMGEMNYIKLQMTMDRLAQFESILSNIMKKISDTQESIIQNLK